MADVWLRSPSPPGVNDVELFCNLTIYWVGGTGNWNDDINHWATSSGGKPGKGNNPATNASPSLGAPSVVFDANSNNSQTGAPMGSYTVTNTVAANTVKDITLDNPTGGTVTVSGIQSTLCNGNFLRLGGSWNGSLILRNDLTPDVKTITLNGGTIGASINYGASMTAGPGTWKYMDAFTTTSTQTFVGGTIDTNSQTVTWTSITWNGATAKTLTLGSSTVNLSSSWLMAVAGVTSTNNTLNAGTSTLNLTGVGSIIWDFGTESFTFNNVNITHFAASTPFLLSNGTTTYNNFTYAPPAVSNDTISIAGTHKINGTFTYTPPLNSQINRPWLKGFPSGNVFTLNLAAVSGIQDLDFADCAVTGAAAPLSGTRLGDVGGNTGITFPDRAIRYWVGNNGSWNQSTGWAVSSGGASNINNYPLPQDLAIFDANSFNADGLGFGSGATVRIGSIDWSALNRPATFNLGSGPTFCGDIILSPRVTMNNFGTMTFVGRKTMRLFSNGVTWGGNVTMAVDCGSGSVLLNDDVNLGTSNNLTGQTLITTGNLNLNGRTIRSGSFAIGAPTSNAITVSQALTRSITSGGGQVLCTQNTANATVFSASSCAGLTVNDAFSIVIADTGGVAKQFTGAQLAADGLLLRNILLKLPSGSYISTLNTSFFGAIDTTGYEGTLSTGGGQIGWSGDLTIGPKTLITGQGQAWIFNGSTVQQINDNAGLANWAVLANVNGAGIKLLSNVNLNIGNGLNALTLTLGSIDLNGWTLQSGSMSSSNGNVRTIKSSAAVQSSGDIVLRTIVPPQPADVELFPSTPALVMGKFRTMSTSAVTAWNLVPPNATIDRTNPWMIEIAGDTANTRSLSAGGFVLPAVVFSCATPNSELDLIGGSMTLKSLSVTNPPQSIKITAGNTITIEDKDGFPSGTPGNLVTITSTTASNHNLVKSGGSTINSKYLSISRSQATPSANPPGTWFAGRTSTNGGNNSGWIFTDLFEDGMAEVLAVTDTPDFIDLVVLDETGSMSAAETTDSIVVFGGDLVESSAAVATISAQVDFFADLSESGIAADTVTGQVDFSAALSESGSSADTWGGGYTVNIPESGSAVDTVSAVVSFAADLSESGASADTVSAVLTAVAALSESLSSAETVSAQVDFSAILSESTSSADTVTGSSDFFGSDSESGSAADTVSAVVTFLADLSESGASVETISATASFVAALSEVGVSAETISAIMTAVATLAETGTAADTTVGANSTSASTSESGSLVDIVSASTFISVDISESSTVSDLLTALLSAIRLDESGSAVDTLTAELIPPFIDLNIFTPDISTSVFMLTLGNVFTPSLKTFFFIPAPETSVIKPAVMEQFTPTGVTSFKPKADTVFTDMPTFIFTPAPEQMSDTPTQETTNFTVK